MSSASTTPTAAMGPDSFVARLLFGEGSRDVFAYAGRSPLDPPARHVLGYSTGTSMILAGSSAGTVGGGRDGMLAFALRELFDPLGMRSAVPEFDAAGTFLGGAFVWANARDWARFGLLFLRDGVWDGARVLPAGWVDLRAHARAGVQQRRVRRAAVAQPRAEGGPVPAAPGRPASAFSVNGNNGQMVVIVPDARSRGGAAGRDAGEHLAVGDGRRGRDGGGLSAARDEE